MSKRQTRRTFSVSRATYDAVTGAAAAEGIACSEWLTRLVRAAIPSLPATPHASPKAEIAPRPLIKMTAADVSAALQPPQAEIIAKLKRPPRDGDPAKADSICAVCVNETGVTLRALGRGNALVAVCSSCDDEPSNSGRYSFEGGRGTGTDQHINRLNGAHRRGGQR